MMREIKAPHRLPYPFDNRLRIFLAGTIDMGQSMDWQSQFVHALNDHDVTIFNPRRDDWNSDWKQDIKNIKFKEQVNWKLDHLEGSDVIIFHFEPESASMITLLEFGLFTREKKISVLMHCPEGYTRKGNVDIVCERYNVQQFETLQEIQTIIKYLTVRKLQIHAQI